MSKRKKLQFQTKKNAEIAKNKRALLYFSSFLLVFATVSMLILLKAYDFDLSTLFNGRKDEIETTQVTQNTSQTTLKSANFLLYCVSDDKKNENNENYIRFIAIINADMKKKIFKVGTISPKNPATVNGKYLSLSDHFIAGGAEQLKKAVEAFGGIEIDRYAGSTDSGFETAIRIAGRIELTIPKQIKHDVDISLDDDFSLSLPKGKQVISADNLLKYIRYNGQLEDGNVGLEIQANIFCSLLKQYINEYNADRGEKLFSLLINSISNTDITIVDYLNCKDAIGILAASKDAPAFKVVQSLQGFDSADTTSVKEETTK